MKRAGKILAILSALLVIARNIISIAKNLDSIFGARQAAAV